MKKMCIAALMLCLTAVSATAQTITAKCKTCGKPIAACPYKGRHPAATPGKKPARQQPARRPQTTRPAVNPEKTNLLNLVAKPFGVVENVSENTTPQQIRDAVSQKLGLDVREGEGSLYLHKGIKHNLCGLSVDWEDVHFRDGKLRTYEYHATVLKSNTSKEEMINTARRMAAMLGLVEIRPNNYLVTDEYITYFENEENLKVVISMEQHSEHVKNDSYRISLKIRYR